MDRWRGRRPAGLAAIVLVASAMAGAAAMARENDTRWIVVRDRAGAELTRAPLPRSNELALRYRNSIYRSIAEEHFQVEADHLDLVELRAEELAVLEEYYTAVGGVRDGSVRSMWSVEVERPPIELPLRIQATALGERTLLTSEEEVSLWRLVADRDDTLVVLSIEPEP
ncbi:MAG: hypothetical protein M3Q38_08715 [Chloroflexota bacterium]|nr:hypothetical protein [Chloroflexota bacterium]